MKRRSATRRPRALRSSTERAAAFKARVLKWAARIRVAPTQIRIQRMTRKWASCSTLGWCSFATDLVDQPRAFQDYVIVHELLHLKVRNHGRVFRALLTAYVPGWQRAARSRIRRARVRIGGLPA